jgi:succinoglycan biosynthesis transport protein ExoP
MTAAEQWGGSSVDTEELDLGLVFDSLRRRWALILLLAAAGALSALVITKFFMQPVYRSTARVIIESGQPPALTPAGTIPLAADTYVELVRGEWLKREVAQKLGLGASDRLPFELAARSVRGTQMVVLEAESADPKMAAQAASATLSVLQEVVRQRQAERFAAAEQRLESQINELAAELGRVRAALAQARSEAERSNFQDQLTRLQAALGQLQASYGNLKLAQAQSGDLIVVLEPPAVPERPVRPSPTLNAAVGGSLGLLAGLTYGAAVAFLDRRFRTVREVEAALGLPVLASVYRGEPAAEGGEFPRRSGSCARISALRPWTGPSRWWRSVRPSPARARRRWPWGWPGLWRPWGSGSCWWTPTCAGRPWTALWVLGGRRGFRTGW